jgi:hypothetical protein
VIGVCIVELTKASLAFGSHPTILKSSPTILGRRLRMSKAPEGFEPRKLKFIDGGKQSIRLDDPGTNRCPQ